MLSPTNGGAIQVYPDALKGTEIMARLLLPNGKVFYEGRLRITKGNFINAPKAQVHGWIRASSRNQADLAGHANDRNTVYASRTGERTARTGWTCPPETLPQAQRRGIACPRYERHDNSALREFQITPCACS